MEKSCISISNYGEYTSDNYGSSRRINIGELGLYFSYDTIVAFTSPKGLRVIQNQWGPTTGKHLNWIDGGDKKSRLEPEQFEKELVELLAGYNLVKN